MHAKRANVSARLSGVFTGEIGAEKNAEMITRGSGVVNHVVAFFGILKRCIDRSPVASPRCIDMVLSSETIIGDLTTVDMWACYYPPIR